MSFFPWRRALRRKSVWFSLLAILIFGLLAFLAHWLAPHDPYRWEVGRTSLPPVWVQNSSTPGDPAYPLGTDRYGRDILSRQLYGVRSAFFLALTAVPLAAAIGALAGLAAGYAGGRLDAGLQYFTGTLQTLPGIMFMVVIILIFRNLFPPTWFFGLLTLLIGFASISWVGLARLVRINVLLLKSQTFIEAARALGASPWQVIIHHLLPNVRHVILVWIINNIPAVILLEALLGYIGVGVTNAIDGSEFTTVTWGGIFFTGRSVLSRNPLMLVIPAVCILLLSMSFILLGDFLNEITRQAPE